MRMVHVLGGGLMGTAILSGLSKKYGVQSLKAVERDADRKVFLEKRGFEVVTCLEKVGPDDIVVLAVKPQEFEAVVEENFVLRNHRGPIISVMAGVTTKALCQALGSARVVRSIPNISTEVQQGVTLYYALTEIDCDLIGAAEMIFDALGVFIRVDTERQIDVGTALVGGGVAIIAHLANSLQSYAESRGMESVDAYLISTQLLYGAAMLMRETNKSHLQICAEVQTAGGTTERAMQVLEENKVRDFTMLALRAAEDRSIELGV